MTDSNQVETTSSLRTITVAANNTAPTVSLTAPANNASYVSPSNVTATATAAGPELNDLLQRVEFYLNGNLAATVTSAPYTWNSPNNPNFPQLPSVSSFGRRSK